jgi:hypothetical protein
VVQLVIAAGKLCFPDEPPILRRTRIEVDYSHRIALSILPGVEQRDICEPFCRGLHCHDG